MIYYFSGTGNSKWIAQELAKATQDRAISIVEAAKRPAKLQTEAAEVFGLVFPVFAWRLPLPVRNFLKNRKKTAAYSVAVATCIAASSLQRHRRKLRRSPSGSVCVRQIRRQNGCAGQEPRSKQI